MKGLHVGICDLEGKKVREETNPTRMCVGLKSVGRYKYVNKCILGTCMISVEAVTEMEKRKREDAYLGLVFCFCFLNLFGTKMSLDLGCLTPRTNI